MTENNLLNKEDLVNLTGAKRPTDQSKILIGHGIFFIHRLNNTIATTWYHVNHPAGHNNEKEEQPDYGVIEDETTQAS